MQFLAFMKWQTRDESPGGFKRVFIRNYSREGLFAQKSNKKGNYRKYKSFSHIPILANSAPLVTSDML